MSQPVHSVLFDQSDLYGQDVASQQQHMPSAGGADGLHFYQTTYDQAASAAYPAPTANDYYTQQGAYPRQIGLGQVQGGFLAAFGTGGFPGEPPLLEELGINFGHIKDKSFAVLNPFRPVDRSIMDDTDLMGPIIFCLLFGMLLLLSGKMHFGYIYGVAVLGCLASYAILNLMSEPGVDIYRTASVLGYSMLPMVGLSGISSTFPLNGMIGYCLAGLTVVWCTFAASGMFVAVLNMSHQRWLVAYPVSLLYSLFALMTVF